MREVADKGGYNSHLGVDSPLTAVNGESLAEGPEKTPCSSNLVFNPEPIDKAEAPGCIPPSVPGPNLPSARPNGTALFLFKKYYLAIQPNKEKLFYNPLPYGDIR
ncbi:MAG: hypothetical protein CO141_04235 [Candidatus Moranbacteria bacterium CG_4_9_14_3_um_filter_42_9]|nr:MAG: hypothetical protein CO141_04235 [Candidatus Moranbacteria bacterium CG_4_9_14_3_um_filter_42_9]